MRAALDGYSLRDLIGSGRHAEVWRGEAVGAPGRVVAIKRFAGPVDLGVVAELRRQRELSVALTHPGLLPLLDIVRDGDGVALVTAYAAGGSLATRLAGKHGALPDVIVAELGAALAPALAALHAAGLVHGDVRPENVLFDGEGRPMLGDIGSTRALDVMGKGPRHDLDDLGAMLISFRRRGRGNAPSDVTGMVERALAHEDSPPSTALALACLTADLERFRDAAGDAGPTPARTPASTPTTEPTPTTGPTSTTGPMSAATSPGPSDGLPDLLPSAGVLGASVGRPASGSPAGHRGDRRLLLAAALLVVLVPLGAVAWLWTSGGTPQPTELAEAGPGTKADGADGAEGGAGAAGDANDPVAEPADRPAAEHPAVDRVAPPPCEGVAPPPGLAGDVLLADVNRAGCSVPVIWDGARLTVPDLDGRAQRFDLGAEPDDVLLFADLTCDGHDTPVLYRPVTGELFRFEALARAGGSITVTGEPTGVLRRTPRVMTTADGCDHIRLAD